MSALLQMANKEFEVQRTDEEWRAVLNPPQYYVMRRHGTEPAGTSPLNFEERKGTYHCAGCQAPLYTSDTKFFSISGWPSFYAPIEDAVDFSTDYLTGYARTEVHCKKCGCHGGHVFDDGPAPTRKRYCINGFSLAFVPSEEEIEAATDQPTANQLNNQPLQ